MTIRRTVLYFIPIGDIMLTMETMNNNGGAVGAGGGFSTLPGEFDSPHLHLGFHTRASGIQGLKGHHPMEKTFTHEQFIHAVRDIAVRRLNDGDRAAALDAKLVYGAGSKHTRGVTYFGCWKNGHEHAFAEVCAFGEDSPIQVAGTTIHELGHVIAGAGKGHGKGWMEACRKLGLNFVRAAGTRYSLACFAPDIRMAIAALPQPTDGQPQPFGGIGPNGAPLHFKLRPCSAGIGVKGGKSRGAGSGSRLRKFTCECGVIARVARDEFHAKCDDCGSAFQRAG